MGVTTHRVVWLSMAGGLLWSAVGLGIGRAFHNSIDDVLSFMETLGTRALVAVVVALGIFILYKYVQRRRRAVVNAVERISLDELKRLIASGDDPVIVDARSLTARGMEEGIPGALVFTECGPDRLMATLDKDRHIVVYCSCPNDVTAAQVAHQFLAHGFHRAKPLHGGLDAWNAGATHRSDARTA
jgi:rhodanese-related sulfurtransferase